MEDSSGSKPFMVTSSVSLKVTTPSFYNQPKKFSSVAPPRPKGGSNQSVPMAVTSSVVSTAVIGRVGEIPPPPSLISDDFPPPPPPVDAELPDPPPECQLTPPAYEAPPPAFPAPPPIAEDLPLPAPPEDISFVPSDPCSAPPPPPPPPPPPAPPLPEHGTAANSQRLFEKQTSFDRQLDSLTDLLSEMETRRPLNPKSLNQPLAMPSLKPSGPPPTAPKPALSFLPPPELQDRPPPAPWAEELRARTTLRHGGASAAPLPAAQPVKQSATTLKTIATPSHPGSSFGPKQVNSSNTTGVRDIHNAPKFSANANNPPPPPAPPAPPMSSASVSAPPVFNSKSTAPASVTAPAGNIKSTFPANVPTPTPAFSNFKTPPSVIVPPSAPTFNHSKTPSPVSQEKRIDPPPVAPETKPAPSPTSFSHSKSMTSPPAPKAPKASIPGAAAPSGGVPLSMKEVEELERMTQDFIKNMDNHPPVITSALTEVCGKCGEALSRSQPAVRAMDKLFHSHCFCCVSCQQPLQGMQFYDRDGSPECEECYVNSLAVCSRCGERITDRVLKAVGQCFHAHCFCCTACSCTLEGAPFITDDNNHPYCVPDYHRRFSPICVSCNEPIVPDPGSEETVRVVALEKNFHLKCYRCEDCVRPLSIEADADGCYPLDGRILCMKCHTKRAKQGMK